MLSKPQLRFVIYLIRCGRIEYRPITYLPDFAPQCRLDPGAPTKNPSDRIRLRFGEQLACYSCWNDCVSPCALQTKRKVVLGRAPGCVTYNGHRED